MRGAGSSRFAAVGAASMLLGVAEEHKKAGRRTSGGAKKQGVRKGSALKFLSSGSHAKRSVTRPAKTLAFGSVVIESPGDVTPEERRKNVRAGQEALERAKTALARSGVTLGLAPDIPKYHVDAEGRLVRVLGEKKQTGKLVNGKFVAID